MKTLLCIACFLMGGLALAAAQENVRREALSGADVKADVYLPAKAAGKLPVVFLAHNGYGKKEDWGAFPKELAALGYVVVSIGWDDFEGAADLAKAVDLALAKYQTAIDARRVAFVGGCHGAVKLLTLLADKKLMAEMSVKAAVAISISEENAGMLDAVKKSTIPILAIYAKADHYGYAAINKKVAEDLLREPKKVLALDASPHGNEMLVDAATKPVVSKEIVDWLAHYLQ